MIKVEPMIRIAGVSKTFSVKDNKVEALKNVSLDIAKGDIYGIIGMSGAGKSTLVRCLNFLERPTEGTVYVEGQDLSTLDAKQLRQLRKHVAMIFQNFNLLMQRTVLDNVCFPMEIAGVDKKTAREKAREFLKVVELSDKEKAYPTQLSGGQKQRVAIARALAMNPTILLCDEATSALDPTTTKSILALLKDINEKYGITIVIITHSMEVVQEICTHVAIMKEGEVKEQGLVEEIFSHPKSQVAKELISKDSGNDVESKKLTQSEIQDGEIVRIVFSENSAFEPVIANLILTFHEPVNILKANTKNVGGVAKGEMILQFMSDSTNVPEMKKFLTERGLEIGEAN